MYQKFKVLAGLWAYRTAKAFLVTLNSGALSCSPHNRFFVTILK